LLGVLLLSPEAGSWWPRGLPVPSRSPVPCPRLGPAGSPLATKLRWCRARDEDRSLGIASLAVSLLPIWHGRQDSATSSAVSRRFGPTAPKIWWPLAFPFAEGLPLCSILLFLCVGGAGAEYRDGSKHCPWLELTVAGPMRRDSTWMSPSLDATEVRTSTSRSWTMQGQQGVNRRRPRPSRSFVDDDSALCNGPVVVFPRDGGATPRFPQPGSRVGFSPIRRKPGEGCLPLTWPCMCSCTCISHLHGAAPAATCTGLSARIVNSFTVTVSFAA